MIKALVHISRCSVPVWFTWCQSIATAHLTCGSFSFKRTRNISLSSTSRICTECVDIGLGSDISRLILFYRFYSPIQPNGLHWIMNSNVTKKKRFNIKKNKNSKTFIIITENLFCIKKQLKSFLLRQKRCSPVRSV